MGKQIIVCLIVSFICNVQPSRILCIFPVPSVSHQMVFRAYTQDLIAKGHELVIVTPNPFYEEGKAPKTVTELNTNYTYQLLQNQFRNQDNIRGVVFPSSKISFESYKFYVDISIMTLEHEELKKIIKDKNQKFDLIVIEAGFKLPVYLKKIFNAPTIWLSSYHGDLSIYHALGAPVWPPFTYPHHLQTRIFNLTIFEELQEIYTICKLYYAFTKLAEVEKKAYHEIFGETDIAYEDLPQLVDLALLNANQVFVNYRPVPPHMIFLGGLHLQPVKPLPPDLKTYLDSSTRGVVYVSLGTNVYPENMTPDLLEAFLGAFEAVPYDVLWKFNGTLENKPNNLRIESWFPQRDMLFHPNIKVFVTQGGLQSTDEAIDAAVPMVGIPMLADQWYNVEQAVRLGISVKVDAVTMEAKDLEDAINKVIDDEAYRNNAIYVRDLMKDDLVTSRERAGWWTEYIIRHKGVKHFRNTPQIGGNQYSMPQLLLGYALDFILRYVISSFVMLKAIYRAIRKIIIGLLCVFKRFIRRLFRR